MGAVAQAGTILQVIRGIDQGNVRESLGEVADQALTARVVFLGEQAHVVTQF